MSEIENIVYKYESAREKFTAEIKSEIYKIFQEFFTNYPQFDSIYWEQYTNYFNDGDECNFYVREREYDAESETDYGFREPNRWDSDSFKATYAALPQETKDEYARLDAAFVDLDGILCEIPDEMYEDIFGDHKKIIVTKDGITVESYTNHD